MRREVVQDPEELGLEGLAPVTRWNRIWNRISSRGNTSIGSSPVDNPNDLVASNISRTTSSRRRGPRRSFGEPSFSSDAHTQRLKCQKIEGGYGTTSVTP